MVKQQRRQINREEKKGNFIGILYLSIYSFYLSTYFYLTPNKPERKTFGFFHLKSNVLSSITQEFLNLQICLFYTFSFKMYMPTKKIFKIKGNKIMFKGSNCDRKSQFSEILTEPLNPRDLYLSAFSPFHLAFYLYFFLSIHVSVQNSFSNSMQLSFFLSIFLPINISHSIYQSFRLLFFLLSISICRRTIKGEGQGPPNLIKGGACPYLK